MGLFKKDLDKGVDCIDDENGVKHCKIVIRHKNSRLASGTEFDVQLDKSCRGHVINRSSIFDDDEPNVKKAIQRAEADCRGDPQ